MNPSYSGSCEYLISVSTLALHTQSQANNALLRVPTFLFWGSKDGYQTVLGQQKTLGNIGVVDIIIVIVIVIVDGGGGIVFSHK